MFSSFNKYEGSSVGYIESYSWTSN